MNIATWVYRRYIASKGVMSKVWYFARVALIKLGDPTCIFPVHGRELKLPLSHQLPAILASCPLYDQLPARIGAHIHGKGEHLTCVDVGANIGDTIASFYTDRDDIFLAIEPYRKFNELLASNWAWNRNVTVYCEYCSSASGTGTFEVEEINGTASMSRSEKGIEISKKTLDEIVAGHAHAADINVIKIDTDGHDLEVIEGAMQLIARNKPIILFECEPVDTVYIESYLNTLKKLSGIGYSSFLLYDSLGNYLGKNPMSDLSPIKRQLLYQMEHGFHDFEILVMEQADLERFSQSEADYFEGRSAGNRGALTQSAAKMYIA